MRIRLSSVLTLSSVLLLAACASLPATQPLPIEAKSKISSTEVVVPIRQGEIYVFVPDSQVAAAGGGGLLLALIDAGVNSVRTSKAEAAVKPLRDAMVDFDFDGTMRDDLKESLSKLNWLHVDNVHVVKEVTNDNMDKVLADSKDSAVLFTTMDYQLSNDASVLTITMYTGLFGKTDELRALKKTKGDFPTAWGNTIYRNTATLKFTSTVPNVTTDRDQNIATWSADHGAAMRDALKKGEMDLASMLASDIDQVGAVQASAK